MSSAASSAVPAGRPVEEDRRERYALIGAGPAGLATARNLKRLGLPFDGYELHTGVGGLWDIDNPQSTVYESAHLISSKCQTEFEEFPMPETTADYPHHSTLRAYFQRYADAFDLREHFHFETEVQRVAPLTEAPGTDWHVTLARRDDERETTVRHAGVLIASGTLHEPNVPTFAGDFSGEMLHSAEYRSASVFEGKRVLIIGAGNSGCDLAVDAVHRARSVTMSLRRGYHIVPKYVLGRPADTIGGALPLPAWLKQKVDALLLRFLRGDPTDFGMPEPDHDLYESHPVVNSLLLYHLGHGDITIQPDIDRFDGRTVHFADGTAKDFDLVLLATGYTLDYPFISRDLLNWKGNAPSLFLNTFHPHYDSLFMMGMFEAAGIGWQGRHEQGEMVARYLRGRQAGTEAARRLREEKQGGATDLSGGYDYLDLDRMAYYVHVGTFRKAVRKRIRRLKRDAPALGAADRGRRTAAFE